LAGFPQVPFFNQVGGDVTIRADRDQLHRILVNLMRNAAQAMTAETDEDEPPPRPPRLSATAHFERGMARIRIEDAGPGLPAAMKAKLFQPFSSAHRGEGSGLGLAIARELARSQGGDLELASSGPDGAAFDLLLPLAHTAASVA
ncbi:MAG: ATP-binding protein, partial [Hyphomonadaceae bacterium]|nr:ATP-binding protein [Hyphomonadaceae bacterium]